MGIQMDEKSYHTPKGTIHYWTAGEGSEEKITLVFLPGLTADHRLFEKQLDYFAPRYRLLVWDAPGHGNSRPFALDFDLADKARWLKEILDAEKVTHPVLVGQSMGGYVGQMFCQLFPECIKGFVSIDSAPLQRKYMTGVEIWLLKRMEPVYRWYPWGLLKKQGTNGVAETAYGRQLMAQMMDLFEGRQEEYAKLSGHGFKMLAEAMEADLPYRIPCPAILICGEKDHAGSCIRYSKAWHKSTGLPLYWIKNAGHNSNTDAPEEVNRLIEQLAQRASE